MEYRIALESHHITAIEAVLDELTERFDSVEDPRFLTEAALYAQELPRDLRLAFRRFTLEEPAGLLRVSGWPVDQERIGPTPGHWKDKNGAGASPVLREEMLLVLFGQLLGEPIGWSTQQDGTVVHDILPIKGHEHEQLGSGSEELLTWHTEDAFHPYRGDYIGMLCLRNPDRVPTTVAYAEDLEIGDELKARLFEERYTIRPDESHLIKNKGEDRQVEGALAAAYERINAMNTSPEPVAVMFGDPRRPYLRLDPYFMDELVDDPEAQESLDALLAEVDDKIRDLVLEAGEYCFIDNFRAVHGRKPFKARFDGTDRWMKRINVTRDLRKSRPLRTSPDSRVIL